MQITPGSGVDHASGATRKPEPKRQTASAALLGLETKIRQAEDVASLQFLLANETKGLIGARQCVVATVSNGSRARIAAISSLSSFDRNAPLVQALENALLELKRDGGFDRPHEFALPPLASKTKPGGGGYPFRQLLWLPIANREGEVFAGLVAARENAWTERAIVVANHIAEAASTSWQLLLARRRRAPDYFKSRKGVLIALGGALIVAAGFIPVPMTTLAPFEVIARSPVVITAPIEGTIDQVLVPPNGAVKATDVLVKFTQTTFRNTFEISEREVHVARSEFKKANQLAFAEERGRHELAIARSNLDVRIAERDYARDMLAKSVVRAGADGIALYNDKSELLGRPVAVGERLMEIADPSSIEVRIDVGVGDAIILRDNATVRLFPDTDPLRPVKARIIRTGYKARLTGAETLAYPVIAQIDDAQARPRLGVRGTAQVFGETVSLAFFIFRRPLSALRQWVGL